MYKKIQSAEFFENVLENMCNQDKGIEFLRAPQDQYSVPSLLQYNATKASTISSLLSSCFPVF
jgi:hypothetical protein